MAPIEAPCCAQAHPTLRNPFTPSAHASSEREARQIHSSEIDSASWDLDGTMATVGQMAVWKQPAVAYSGQIWHALYLDGGGSSRASHVRIWVNFPLVGKEKNRQICYQFGSHSLKRQVVGSRAIILTSASSSANNGVDVEGFRSKFDALLYCGKSVPEEKIEKPSGLPAQALPVRNKPKCLVCEAKGAVVCATCAGTGLYVDSVLESQGIIVRVRCLGCGGSGSTMCSKCWGRGHV